MTVGVEVNEATHDNTPKNTKFGVTRLGRPDPILYAVLMNMGKLIVGVDEAGRGPIAGPVAMGIVVAPEDFDFLKIFPGLNDSKKMSEKARENTFATLLAQVEAGQLRYHVALRSAVLIDSEGIVPSVYSGVEEGIRALMPDASQGRVVLDGSLLAPREYAQKTIIGGDGIEPAIMLASVAAKVTRDRLMVELAKEYPLYGFEQHKGYGTKAHYEAIRNHGVSKEHRLSFLSRFLETEQGIKR